MGSHVSKNFITNDQKHGTTWSRRLSALSERERMIAAIYARKSTEQSGVAEDAKSVARQIEHAKGASLKRGWAGRPTKIVERDTDYSVRKQLP